MSSMVRSMQRDMIRRKCRKRDGNTKQFRTEWYKWCKWYKYHYGLNLAPAVNDKKIGKVSLRNKIKRAAKSLVKKITNHKSK